ncbi:hypothetical protein BGX30_005732 [Mortierella sp. GBA39]|nr:hypothetical protein BGX30_005732 [Mortierella sp. GBA39]
MCGITGFIQWSGDLTQDSQILVKMTETMSDRGPDASGTWISNPCAFGHRRLSVIDPENGAQPMIVHDDDDVYAICYNGELYNAAELRSELVKRGHHFRTHCDTEVLLVSYIEWGPACVDRFNGIFAFAIWDSVREQVFMARDRLGVKPLFYAYIDGTLIFGSEPKALLQHPKLEPVVGPEGLAEVFIIGPARTPGQGETAAKLRELLQDTLERQLVSDVPVCTLLSGGLDSSALTALAVQYYNRTNQGQVHTYSVDYVGNEKHFKSHAFQPGADAPFIQRMVEELGTQHHYIEFDTPELVESLNASTLTRDLPGMADVDGSLYLFCPSLLSPEIREWIRPLDYLGDRYADAVREVPKLRGETGQQAKMRVMSYLNITRFMPTLLDRKDRMSMGVGLEVRVPYCDHRLVQYVWNIPWEIKITGGREKGILRKALEGVLPDDVLYRKKSPYPKTHNPDFLAAVKQQMLDILDDPSAPILPLIDKNKILEIAASPEASSNLPWFGQLMSGPQLFAYLAQVNNWLKTYNVAIR